MVDGREKILPLDRLAPLIAELKKQGRKIVFTNGCFDLLHAGHVRYLAQAKALGDILVVGLNSDASVRALKGEGRPLVPEDDRAEVLAGLAAVDYVVIFPEATAAPTIEALRPDLQVKGGDYTADQIPETPAMRAVGGEVVVVSEAPGRSTTSLIDRIREQHLHPNSGKGTS
jgi:rfaE bifunctional protein nucleotidyltransferase chain/domain